MTNAERQALNMMNSVDNFEVPSRLAGVSTGVGLTANAGYGNKMYKAQVDISVNLVYANFTAQTFASTESEYTYLALGGVEVLPAALPANQKTVAPIFLFGYSDFYGGYNKAIQVKPSQNWTYQGSKIVDGESMSWDININNTVVNVPSIAVRTKKAKRGDLIIAEYFLVAGGAATVQGYLREIVISCKQVAYGTLLNSIASDLFSFNAIKYLIPDSTKISQFTNEFTFLSQTLFGKTTNDSVNPNSYLSVMQQQINLREIDIEIAIDKSKSLCLYLNYDCTEIQMSFFIPIVNKR